MAYRLELKRIRWKLENRQCGADNEVKQAALDWLNSEIAQLEGE